jgi:hypothetical protein
MILSFGCAFGPGVDSADVRNKNQACLLGVKAVGA